MATDDRPSFWKRTSGKIVILATITTGIVTLLANLTAISTYFEDKFGPDKGVQVVDVSVDDTTVGTTGPVQEDSGFATTARYEIAGVNFKDQNTMDIQLRNNGSENASLKRLDLVIKKKWKIKPKINVIMRTLPSTATYDIPIDLSKAAPETYSARVRHDIPPMDSELFTVRVNGERRDGDENTYVYLADVKIIFNETSEVVAKNNILFGFQKYPLPDAGDAANKLNIQAIREQPGEKSPLVDRLISNF